MEAFPAEGFGPRGRGSRGGGESRRGRGGRGRGSGGTGGSPSVGGGRGRGRGRRGSSPVRGGRGRGGPVVWSGGGQATSRGGAAPHRLLPTEIFLDPLVGPCLPLKGHRWIIIRNLPVLRVQDSHTLCDFIAQLIHVKVHKLWFKVPTNECQRLAALSLFPSPSDCYTCIEKLHGQVYHNHRLLVGGYKVGAGSTNECFVTENCIKITNLSKAVTVDTLWNCFESCGQLGMIYLRPGPGDGKVEALVNFEDSDSVMNALKLNGATLDETIMEVVYLDWKLSVCVFPLDRFPDGYLASILKDVEGVTHVEYAHKQSKSAQVFLSDETSYSVALNLDRQCLNGNYLSVKPPTKLLYLIPSNIDLLDFEAFSVVLNTSKVTPHPRKRGVLVLHFYTQSDADAALQSSPVLINGQSLTLYDSVSKVSSTMAKLEVTGAEDEDDNVSTELDGVVIPRKHTKEMGNYEKMLNESEELRKKKMLIKSLERAAKATSPFEGQQNQLLSKRKRNNTKTLKKSKKEKK